MLGQDRSALGGLLLGRRRLLGRRGLLGGDGHDLGADAANRRGVDRRRGAARWRRPGAPLAAASACRRGGRRRSRASSLRRSRRRPCPSACWRPWYLPAIPLPDVAPIAIPPLDTSKARAT